MTESFPLPKQRLDQGEGFDAFEFFYLAMGKVGQNLWNLLKSIFQGHQSFFSTLFGLPMVKNGQKAGVVSIYFSYCGPIFRRNPGSSSSLIAKTMYVEATEANKRWPSMKFTKFLGFESRPQVRACPVIYQCEFHSFCHHRRWPEHDEEACHNWMTN